MSVPPRFRDQILETGQDTLVITNYSDCIYAYPAADWSRIEEKLSRVSSVDKKLNTFLRFFIGGAVEVAPDKQGRIPIPPTLRAYAGLDRDAVIIGMPNRFEIWSRERWDVEVGRFEKEGFEDPELTREIANLGI